MLYQQGDVLIKSGKIPQKAKKIKSKDGKYVLAEGEATGHSHSIIDVPEVEFYKEDRQLFFKTTKDVTVTHEEHNPITIKSGEYLIDIVQEYDHFEEEARRVID